MTPTAAKIVSIHLFWIDLVIFIPYARGGGGVMSKKVDVLNQNCKLIVAEGRAKGRAAVIS